MTRKPLSPAAVDALNRCLRTIAERLEQRRARDELARRTEEQRRAIERMFPSETRWGQ